MPVRRPRRSATTRTFTQAIDASGLDAVSCIAGSTTCVAANSDGGLAYATDVSATAAASWAPWAGHGESPGEAVACPTGTLCLLAAGEVDGKAAGNLYRAGSLTAVSCVGATCAAAGAGGEVFASTDGGVDWTQRYGEGPPFTGVSCASGSLCAAVATSGDVTAFDPATVTLPLVVSTAALPAGRAGSPYEARVDADGGTPATNGRRPGCRRAS